MSKEQELDVDPDLEKLPGQWGNMKMCVTRAMRKEIKCLEARTGKDTFGLMTKVSSELGFDGQGSCERWAIQ